MGTTPNTTIKTNDKKTNKRVTFSNDIQQSNNNSTKQRQSSSLSSTIQNSAKKVLISTSISSINNKKNNNNQAAATTGANVISAGYTGVTDIDLEESKDISFNGVMDYENNNSHREHEEQKHKEHESYVLSLL